MKKIGSFSPSYLLFALLWLAVAAGCSGGRKGGLAKIESRLRKALELPTVEYIYKDIVYIGDKKTFLFLTTVDKKLLFSVNLRLQAGIDLRKDGLTLLPDGADPKKIVVRLPRAAVLLLDADERSIHQYFAVERGERFGRLEFAREIERVKPRLEKDARDRGILRKAEVNAETIIRSFLELAGYEVILFEPFPQEVR